jgi:hypothetical protein
MDADELLRLAWEAVKKSQVPQSLQGVAFTEAVAFIRAGELRSSPPAADRPGETRGAPGRRAGKRHAPVSGGDDFFARLADESGVDEAELQEVLHLEDDGKTVRVAPPARRLGKTKSEQAKTVITLVAGARHAGLGEIPVSVENVRAECKKKGCYDRTNFAQYHVGRLQGFNLKGRGDSAQVLVNAKWVAEFDAAIARVVGRQDGDNR